MKINVLMENFASKECFESGHGLSFFIEGEKNILLDMGPDGRFIGNAEKMGIDLKSTDFGMLSHGHYDHGGGLSEFIEKFPGKNIYISEFAFGDYCVLKDGLKRYIGIEKGIKEKAETILTKGITEIDKNIMIFSGVDEKKYFSEANKVLLEEKDGEFFEDSFSHEQYLIIKEDEKTVLFSGCAHLGVVNIVEKAKDILGEYPDYVFSGFHLYNPSNGVYEDKELIESIGNYIKNTGTKFFTCHCTGVEAYKILKGILGENIEYISAGDFVEI